MKLNGISGWLVFIGALISGYGGILAIMNGPANSEAQAIFRMSLFPVGVGILLIGLAISYFKKKQ